MDALNAEHLQQYVNESITLVIAYLPKLLLAFVVLIVGLWLIGRVTRLAGLALERGDADATLANFLKSLISISLKVLLLISVASMVGVATTSFVAVLGAAGLAIGLALQGSLGNFAGGVLILLFRPFKVGDFIETQGVMGSVRSIQIFSTVLNTLDNKRVIVPNGPLANNIITNFSAEDTRRLELVFGIGYNDDLAQAKQIIDAMLDADGRVRAEPAYEVVVSELADSSVNLRVRAWCDRGNLGKLSTDLTEQVKLAFDAAGISIPFPQTDVHLQKVGL